MKLTAWRIVLPQYTPTAFDGEGARRYGGRFNGKGTPMVYAASSLALAMLELLVHLDRERAMARHEAIPVAFDDQHVLTLDPRALPDGWGAPEPPTAVQAVGDAWVRSRASLVLRVPSVLLPDDVAAQEHNYLINPLHDEVQALEIGPAHALKFDERFRVG